jgi:integrase
MPKKRNPENRGLPVGWRQAHGAFYYRVPVGMESWWDGKKLFRLGKTLPEAWGEWARRQAAPNEARTVGQLLDRYMIEVVPTKAQTTQRAQQQHCKQVRAVFGDMSLIGVKPQFVYAYIDKRSAKVSARHEVELLRHALTMAVRWGYIDRHPFKGQTRLDKPESRTRYVTDAEIDACLALEPKRFKGSVKMCQAYIRLKLLVGLRKADILRLGMDQLKDDGIHITTGKTGKPVIFTWTDALREAVAQAKAVRPVHISPYLFCNRQGECYVTDAGRTGSFDSVWRSFLGRVKDEAGIDHFTEHDIRAKVASDAESVERAQEVLTHSSPTITAKVYRRAATKVKPIR